MQFVSSQTFKIYIWELTNYIKILGTLYSFPMNHAQCCAHLAQTRSFPVASRTRA